MIVYFSATGNSKFVANQIASSIGDDINSILDVDEIILSNNESLGFVFPTYFWGLPSIVSETLSNIRIKLNNNYIYFIATYGTSSGQISKFVESYLKLHNIDLNAKYAVKMPDTWTPTYDLSNKEEVSQLNYGELPQINKIINHIKNKDDGDFIESKIPMFACKIAQRFYEKRRQTCHLHVENNCIGCKLCSKNCPCHAIKIHNDKPIWVKDKCAMCLACLHHCPKFSIQYDNRTKNHGQYTHPKNI